MNRKFKVWDKVEKKMHSSDCNIFALQTNGELYRFVGSHEVVLANPNRYVVLFCTGLKDMNDKFIYDKDIIHDSKEHGLWTVSYSENYGGYIAYNQVNSDRRIEISTEFANTVYLDGDIASSFNTHSEVNIVCEVSGNEFEDSKLMENR